MQEMHTETCVLQNKMKRVQSASMAQPLATVCLGKLHRVTVTEANLDYVGSITIDKDLLDASGLFPNMLVKINNIRNGISWETYILEGEAHKGEIKLNGPPANHFKPGDIVIILGYVQLPLEEAKKTGGPTVVLVDASNKVTEVRKNWKL
jgi:aspartate 1-decarboxylase